MSNGRGVSGGLSGRVPPEGRGKQPLDAAEQSLELLGAVLRSQHSRDSHGRRRDPRIDQSGETMDIQRLFYR